MKKTGFFLFALLIAPLLTKAADLSDLTYTATDGNNITLGLTIEQSDNLTEWTKLDGEMSRTIPIPDGKKFYRFALDK